VNPDIKLSYGLSTNPNYGATAASMYQAWADANAITALTAQPAKAWLNDIGDGVPDMTLSFLKMVQNYAPVTAHSSVQFLKPGGGLSVTQSPGGTSSSFWLGTSGRSAVFTTGPVLAGEVHGLLHMPAVTPFTAEMPAGVGRPERAKLPGLTWLLPLRPGTLRSPDLGIDNICETPANGLLSWIYLQRLSFG
jgi:hypothetical protein